MSEGQGQQINVRETPNVKFLEFQKKLKETAQGTAFVRALFTGDYEKFFYTKNGQFNPRAITEILIQFGLEIPREVELSVASAQLLVTGGAAVDAAGGLSALNATQVATLSGATLRLVSMIGKESGWIKDEDEPAAQVLSIGSNVALIVSSGGSNVMGWAGLILDIQRFGFGQDAKATALARQRLSKNYASIMRPQIKKLGQIFSDYQSDKMPMYEFIAKFAIDGPDLFHQVVPGLEIMLPPYYRKISATGTHTGWFTSSTRTEKKEWASITHYNKYQIQHSIFKFMIEPCMRPYMESHEYYNNIRREDAAGSRGVGKIDFASIAMLRMLNLAPSYYADNYDINESLKMGNLTPFDMPSNLLQKDFHLDKMLNWDDKFFEGVSNNISPAYVVNGKPYFTPEQKRLIELQQKHTEMRHNWREFKSVVRRADRAGAIGFLQKFQIVRDVIREWGDLDTIEEIDLKRQAWKENPVVENIENVGWTPKLKKLKKEIDDIELLQDTLKILWSQLKEIDAIKGDVQTGSILDVDTARKNYPNVSDEEFAVLSKKIESLTQQYRLEIKKVFPLDYGISFETIDRAKKRVKKEFDREFDLRFSKLSLDQRLEMYPLPFVDFREVQNFIAAASLLDQFHEGYFINKQGQRIETTFFDEYTKSSGGGFHAKWMYRGGLDNFKNELKELQFKQVFRGLNQVAFMNLADLLGTDLKNIQRVDNQEVDQPAVFKIKG